MSTVNADAPVSSLHLHRSSRPATAKLGASMADVLIPSPSEMSGSFSPKGLLSKFGGPAQRELVVRVNPNAKIAEDIKHLGGRVIRDVGPIRTVELPAKAVMEACSIEAIRSIRPMRYLEPRLDGVASLHGFATYRRDLGTDKRKGEGVVIGIVDSGIHGTHPAFQNRLLECWDQTVKGKGVEGYEYGALLKPNQSSDRTGHGTHVAGIAAGDDSLFCGVAPRARIIAVRTTFRNTHISDAIAYIFARAEQLQAPAVVNLSLGGHGDPHDGTSDLDLQIGFESGPGHIVVAAAGNEGGDGIHTHIALEMGEETLVGFRVPPLAARVALNIWYSGGEAEIAVSSPSGASTPFQPPGEINFASEYPLGSAGRVVLTTPLRNEDNGDHEAIVRVDSPNSVQAGRWFLHVRAVTDAIDLHAWSLHDNTEADVTFSVPVNSHLIGSPGAAPAALTAAAYVSKNRWTDATGQQRMVLYPLDTVAPFSSPGPLRKSADSKPDFALAGEKIVSCRSDAAHYDPSDEIDAGHVAMGGTSMACAVLSGLVATMLEEHPTWEAGDIASSLKPLSRGTYSPEDGYGVIRW